MPGRVTDFFVPCRNSALATFKMVDIAIKSEQLVANGIFVQIRAMVFWTSARATKQSRQFWQVAAARAMTLIVLWTLIAPLPASAVGFALDPASVAVTSTTTDTDSPDPSADSGLVRHAHCPCHSAVQPLLPAVPIATFASKADNPAIADAEHRPGATHRLLKPPRT